MLINLLCLYSSIFVRKLFFGKYAPSGVWDATRSQLMLRVGGITILQAGILSLSFWKTCPSMSNCQLARMACNPSTSWKYWTSIIQCVLLILLKSIC